MNMCTSDLSKRGLLLNVITLSFCFLLLNLFHSEGVEVLCKQRCFFVQKQWLKINNKLGEKKGCFCPHYPFIKPSLDCTFPRSSIFNQRLGWLVPWKISLYVCAYSVSVLCAFLFPFCGYCLCGLWVKCSWVNAEGQQLVWVQVIEGAQVRQPQEEFGKEGGVIWTMASYQWAQGTGQTLL